MTSRELVALQFDYHDHAYHDNLSTLLSLIRQSKEDAIVTAPELCLTHFSYHDMHQAALFSQQALAEILPLSANRIITFTMIEERDGTFYNSAKILHHQKIFYAQDKVKLFPLGEEQQHFSPGKRENIKIITIDNIKFAILICFEIRFAALWEQVKGADIILVPALWGKIRKAQFQSITQALAIMNQAFVIASDASDEDSAAQSAIITPFGESTSDDSKAFLSLDADLKEIKKMRRYIDIGLS